MLSKVYDTITKKSLLSKEYISLSDFIVKK